MEVEVAVLDCLWMSLISLMISASQSNAETKLQSELRSCMTAEVAVLGSLPLIINPDDFCGRKEIQKRNCRQSSGAV